MFNTSCLLISYRKMYQNDKTVTVANGESVPVEGVGRCGILKVVYFVPLLSHSLLSVRALTQQEMDVVFTGDQAIISSGR